MERKTERKTERREERVEKVEAPATAATPKMATATLLS